MKKIQMVDLMSQYQNIKQAVDDGATVPISYESRLIKIRLNQEIANKFDICFAV